MPFLHIQFVFETSHWLQMIIFSEPMTITLCGLMWLKYSLGELCIIGLWEEILHPKNLLFVGSGSSLLTGCLVSTLEPQYSLNTEARVIHLARLDHVTPLLKTSNGSPFHLQQKAADMWAAFQVTAGTILPNVLWIYITWSTAFQSELFISKPNCISMTYILSFWW